MSKRKYLTIAELEEYANIEVTDEALAKKQISRAEDLIDSFVGPQIKFLRHEIVGLAVEGGTATIKLEQQHQFLYEKDYFKYTEIKIIGGTGEGQVRTVLSSTKEGVLTVDSNWSTAPNSSSYYQINQRAKFPRYVDVKYYTTIQPSVYLKTIPEAVKLATAAQVQYMNEMGESFFDTDKSEKTSERLGDYSYSVGVGTGGGVTGVARFIAPKAKMLLRGIQNRTGAIL